MAALAGDARACLTVAHFDHRLRPDSTADAEFVASVSRGLGLQCEVAAWKDPPGPEVGGLEAAARQARYAFLRAVAEARNARFVATAHTADDQAETILHRIVRGTGLRGLAGIRQQRPLSPTITLVRPLLTVRRTELLEYLRMLRQDFRTDASNSDRRRTRNRLRHELLPLLAEQFNPQAAEALNRLGQMAGEAQQTIDLLAGRLLAAAIIGRSSESVDLEVKAWDQEPAPLVQAALQQLWSQQQWPESGMSAVHWRRLVAVAMGSLPARRLELPHGIRAVRRRTKLSVTGTALPSGAAS
jgi:tRNA(Ile)-lysidine synthase